MELLDAERLVPSRDPRLVLDQVAAVAPGPCSTTRAHMLRFAAGHPDALDRRCRPGHFTASALILAEGRDRFLLLHHTKLRRWLQPGGHADGDANLAHVAWCEATEETGIGDLRVAVPAIDLDIHRVEPPGEGAHDHLDVRFLMLAPGDAVIAPNHESTAQRWVGLSDLARLGCDPGIGRMARAALAAAAALVR